jgi:hypothetical protein
MKKTFTLIILTALLAIYYPLFAHTGKHNLRAFDSDTTKTVLTSNPLPPPAVIHTAYSDAIQISKYLDTLRPGKLPDSASNRLITKVGDLVVPYLRDTTKTNKDLIYSFSKELYLVMLKYLHLADSYSISNFLLAQKLVRNNDLAICKYYIKYSDLSVALSKQNAASPLSKSTILINRQFLSQKIAIKPHIDSLRAKLLKDSTGVLLKEALKKTADTTLAQFDQELAIYSAYVDHVDTLNIAIKRLMELDAKVKHIWSSISPVDLRRFKGIVPDDDSQRSFVAIAKENIQSPVVTAFSSQSAPNGQQISLANFSSTQLIDGVAIFMVNRFKQDVVLNFLTTLKNYSKRQPLLLDMFPKTFGILNEYPDYEIPRFGQIWSHAIAEDLVNMPENVATGGYIKTLKLGSNQEILNVFIDVITIAKQVRLQVSFPDMVSYFNNNQQLKSSYLQEMFAIVDMVNRQLQSTDGGAGYWIDWSTSFSKMRQDQLGIMIGLLENQYPKVFAFFDKKILQITGTKPEELANAQAHLQLFRNYLSNLLLVLNDYQKSQLAYAAKVKADPKAAYSGISFWEMEQGLITAASDITVVLPPTKTTIPIKRYLDISGKCLNIYKEIEDKNYAAMVHESLEIITDIMPKSEVFANIMIKNWKLSKDKYVVAYKKMQPYLASVSYILNNHPNGQEKDLLSIDSAMTLLYKLTDGDKGDKQIAKLMIYKSIEELKKNVATIYTLQKLDSTVIVVAKESNIYFISKFAEFFTDLLSAKNNTDVANVISSYAAAPNSYKIKRDSRVSISLNSYIGFYGGAESNSLGFLGKNANVKPVYGITAPIGFAFSWGLHRLAQKLTSETFLGRDYQPKELTGNLNFLDIGAAVAYRIENGTQGGLPQSINFSQILSPGVSFGYGLRNVPIHILAGLQYTPRLRTLTNNTSGTPVTNPTGQQIFRLFAGIFYDLPFVNISKR